MSETEKTVFREQKAADPEGLGGYLLVTGTGPWLVLLAAALVLAAAFIWAFFGTVQTTVNGAGYCAGGVLRCYVARGELGEITEKSAVTVGETKGAVIAIDSEMQNPSALPDEVLRLLPTADRYGTVRVSCPLEDGLYAVTFSQKTAAPFSLRMQGD